MRMHKPEKSRKTTKMQPNCIRDTSKACFNTCCLNPLLLPDQPDHTHTSSPPNNIDPRHNFVSAILSSIQPNATFTNHESLPSSEELFANLTNAFPSYSSTALADDIRAREYYHLSSSNHVCLDYIGHGLFSYSQQKGSNQIPTTTETASSSSSFSSSAYAPFFDISYKSVNLNSYLLNKSQESEFEAAMRERITRYMNMSETDYSLVFTANHSSAFKILADSYPFQSNRTLLTVYDHDNEAVQSMVQTAKKRGARAQSALFSWPNFRVSSKKLRKLIVNKKSKPKTRGLFAFPLQSRITGTRYSYQWMNLARENGWHVLLDASALGAKDMETLGLSLFHPDFLVCSFYNIFGENPSGFCCLFIKNSIIPHLTQSSTHIGIINLIPRNISIVDETNESNEAGKEAEITELDKQNEPSLLRLECRGLDHADELGLILISSRLRCLTNWLINALLTLRHPHSGNSIPLITIYGPRIKLDRGAALAFSVHDWIGETIDPVLVQKLADRSNISVACGTLKNVWFSEKRNRRGKEGDIGVGVVSISVGMLNDFEDMVKVWRFVSRFLDADFVEKERWRYKALNRKTVEVL